MKETQDDTAAALEPTERGPLSYIAGYIVSKLVHKNRTKKGQSNAEIQAILQVVKSTETVLLFLLEPEVDLHAVVTIYSILLRLQSWHLEVRSARSRIH